MFELICVVEWRGPIRLLRVFIVVHVFTVSMLVVLADLWWFVNLRWKYSSCCSLFLLLLRHRPRTDLFILISLGLSARSSSLGDEDRLFASQMILTGTRVNNMTNWCSSSQSMIGFNNSNQNEWNERTMSDWVKERRDEEGGREKKVDLRVMKRRMNEEVKWLEWVWCKRW